MGIHANSIVKAAGVLAVVVSASALVIGQGAQPAAPQGRGRGAAAVPKPPSGPAPRMSNGKPDLSGHWVNPYTPNMAARNTVLDPKTRQPLTFRQGEELKDAAANATGNAVRTFDLPHGVGIEAVEGIRPGQERGLCRQLPALRDVAEHQLAPWSPDCPEPGRARVPVRAEHLVPLCDQRQLQWPADIPEGWNGSPADTGKATR